MYPGQCFMACTFLLSTPSLPISSSCQMLHRRPETKIGASRIIIPSVYTCMHARMHVCPHHYIPLHTHNIIKAPALCPHLPPCDVQHSAPLPTPCMFPPYLHVTAPPPSSTNSPCPHRQHTARAPKINSSSPTSFRLISSCPLHSFNSSSSSLPLPPPSHPAILTSSHPS